MGNQTDGEIERENLGRHIIGCFYAVLFLAGLTNIFLLYIIPRRKYLRTVSNVQIFNICLADFLYSLGLPFVMVSQIKESWAFGTTACHLLLTFEAVAKEGIICFITLAAVERYLSVCKPLFRRRYWTLRNAVFISIAAWLFAGMIMFPVIVNIEAGTIRDRYYHYVNRTHIVYSNYTVHYCNILWPGDDHTTGGISGMKKSFVTYTSVLYIFFTVTIIGCYWSIIRKVSSSSRRLLKHHTSSSAANIAPHHDASQPSEQSNATKENSIGVNGDKDETSGKHREPLYTKRRNTNTANTYIPSRPPLSTIKNNKNCGSRRGDMNGTNTNDHFNGGASVRARAYRKVTKMVLILVAVYFVCWTPYWTQNFMATYRLFPLNSHHRDSLRLILNAVHMLPYLNCGVNPVIYAFLTDNFKDALCHGGGTAGGGQYEDNSNHQQGGRGMRRGRFRGLLVNRWSNLQQSEGSVSNTNGYLNTTEVTLTTTSMHMDNSTRRRQSFLSIGTTRLHSFSSFNWRSGGGNSTARARARTMSSPKLDASHRRSIPSQQQNAGCYIRRETDLVNRQQLSSGKERREKLRMCSARAAGVGSISSNNRSQGIMKAIFGPNVTGSQQKGAGCSLNNQNLLMVHAAPPALAINSTPIVAGECSTMGPTKQSGAAEVLSERTPLFAPNQQNININNKITHSDFGSSKTTNDYHKSPVLINKNEEDQFSSLSSSSCNSDDESVSPTTNPPKHHQKSSKMKKSYNETFTNQKSSSSASSSSSSASTTPDNDGDESQKIHAENTNFSYVNYYQEETWPSTGNEDKRSKNVPNLKCTKNQAFGRRKSNDK